MIVWQRSSFCSGGDCVEVARRGGHVLVRDSKAPDFLPLVFTEREWADFVRRVKVGEFDAVRGGVAGSVAPRVGVERRNPSASAGELRARNGFGPVPAAGEGEQC